MSKLATIATFDNPLDANISKGLLESQGIWCTLLNENIVSLNWFYNNALGGIKLCVSDEDVHDAKEVLAIESEEISCPNCNSIKFKEVQFNGWVIGILKLFLMIICDMFFLIFYRNRKKISLKYKCEDCGYEFKLNDLSQ